MTHFARLCLAGALLSHAAAVPGAAGQLPDGSQKQTVLKLCGTCHSANLVLGRGMTREQWGDTVSSMVARGAKGSPEEFSQVVDYLAANFPPKASATKAPAAATTKAKKPASIGQGADDQQVVDDVLADRGKKIYIAECITCHGPKARGANEGPPNLRGPDLVRSVTVLHDRYGNTIGAFLRQGHVTQSGTPSADFTATQIVDLSHFLHQRVGDTLRSGPFNSVLNVLTGDAKAGAAYFNGEGKCSTCHSPSGDLAGIARRYDPPTLQQRYLFPATPSFGGRNAKSGKPVILTVTPPDGPAVTGELVRLDDFNAALRDSAGDHHSWKRTPALKVEKNDPYATHNALLEQYTDKNIHDVVAYLETLK
ncbi:MAG TPA: cytochrome c [Bryobacteraceae bacterium]|nr:cytochrome c [Bryobacteraceae bacterium]